MDGFVAPGARRKQRSLIKVSANSSDQPLTGIEDASTKDNDVCGSDISSSDEENQEDEEAGRRNGIRLLDVASLSVEGSQGHANEDRYVVTGNERFHLLAVMDGHGGSWAGDFLVEELFNTLDGVYDDGFDDSKLSKAMEELDRTFCAKATRKMDTSGACLLAVLLFVDKGTPKKIVLNIGDCRAIVREASVDPATGARKAKDRTPPVSTTSGRTLALSEDHCAGNTKERVRAVKSGAFIQNNRIAGVLEPFRTIGDIDMKGPGMQNWVIPTPEIHQSELLVGRSILVIATDGVWCVLNNNRAMALAVKEIGAYGTRPSAEAAAHAIVTEARELGSCDDITVIVVSV